MSRCSTTYNREAKINTRKERDPNSMFYETPEDKLKPRRTEWIEEIMCDIRLWRKYIECHQ